MPAHLATVVLTACLTVLLSGCAGQPGGGQPAADHGDKAPPMTLSDFYGFCSAVPTPGGCYSDPVCQGFRKELAGAPGDLAGCLAICRRLGSALYVEDLTNGCEHLLERAQDLCDQFCRRRDAS